MKELLAVCLGAFISLIGVHSYIRYLKQREQKFEAIDQKMKEIDVLVPELDI